MPDYPTPSFGLNVDLNGVPLFAPPKAFSTGSKGWYYSGKGEMEGERVQISISVVIIGSKPKAPEEAKEGQGQPQETKEPPQTPPESNGAVKRPKGRPKPSNAV